MLLNAGWIWEDVCRELNTGDHIKPLQPPTPTATPNPTTMASRIFGFLNYRDAVRNEHGASMVEYALLASLIAVAAVSAVTKLGDETRDTFVTVAGAAGFVPDGSGDGPTID